MVQRIVCTGFFYKQPSQGAILAITAPHNVQLCINLCCNYLCVRKITVTTVAYDAPEQILDSTLTVRRFEADLEQRGVRDAHGTSGAGMRQHLARDRVWRGPEQLLVLSAFGDNLAKCSQHALAIGRFGNALGQRLYQVVHWLDIGLFGRREGAAPSRRAESMQVEEIVLLTRGQESQH